MYRQMRENQRHDRHGCAHQNPAHHAPDRIAAHDHPVGERRYQHFLDVLAELRSEERGHDVAVRVGDHRHHDQSGRDVLLVVEAVHGADPPADETAEDGEIQHRGHSRRHDGLAPDADDAAVFADDDGLEADPAHHVEADRWRYGCLDDAAHRGDPACARAAGAVAGTAAARTASSAPRPSTRRMKISSSRLTLLRMLSTSMPSAESRAKMSLRFSSFDTSTSSVWSSTSVTA